MEVYCHGLSHQTPFLGKALHLIKDYPPKKENNFSRQHLGPSIKDVGIFSDVFDTPLPMSEF
jgi:hypothetical protein